MKRSILLLTLVALVWACGGTEARSGGTLPGPATSLPTSTTSPSTTPTAVTTTDGGTPSTTSAATTPPSTTAPAETPGSTVTVYFLKGAQEAVPVERVVEGPGVALGAIEALIAGPTSSESSNGLSSAVPPDSLVLGLTIDEGTATVDMSLEFESGGGSASVLGRLAQLVYTVTEFDNVDQVRLMMEDEAVEYFSGEGVIVDEPLTRSDFTDSLPISGERLDTAAPTWEQQDLDSVKPGPEYRVVLVAADDFLNVREQPGVEGEITGRLRPSATVRLTGDTAEVGASTWVQVRTPAGPGWVNGFYLTPARIEGSFAEESADLLTDISDRFARGSDFADLVSSRGLWVAHHAPPVRFDREELDGLLDDPTTHRWGSNALEPNSPEIQPRTFAEAVADRFVGAYDDPNREVLVGEAVEGPNGRPPEFALPAEFEGFPFVTVFDPGDDPQYEGLDWTTWIVSFSYEAGDLKVVGMTLDEWAP